MKRITLFISLFIIMSNIFPQEYLVGVDLSYLNEMEDCGAIYYDNDLALSPYFIFENHGANTVRFRLWHTPDWTNYSNFNDIKKSITRAKSMDLKIILDFHYSDTWADPAHQLRPAAWNGITDNTILADSLFNYTYKVLNDLNNLDLLPDYVQIGNETNPNILLEEGEDLWPLNWSRNVPLFQAGIQAIEDINENTGSDVKTIIHIADPDNLDWWFTEASDNDFTNFDIIGVSYYSGWHGGDIEEVGQEIKSAKEKFGKDVLIVEAGYPWTLGWQDNADNIIGAEFILDGYPNPPTPEGQRDFLINLTNAVIDNDGLGLIYWEPTWISTSCSTLWAQGSHYENATFFDFENKVHEGVEFLSFDYLDSELVVNEESYIELFPNPVKDNIAFNTNWNAFSVLIYNVLGELILQSEIKMNTTNQLDIKQLNSGFYSCIILNPNKNIIAKSFIKL